MLSLAEYRAYSSELLQISYDIEEQQAIANKVSNTVAARAKARQLAEDYQEQYEDLLARAINEVAINAAYHYYDKLNLHKADIDSIIEKILEIQWTERFFGLTLNQRLRMNYIRLQRRIDRSALIGADKLVDVYTKTVPFGSQYLMDNRNLLGALVKVENDTAKAFAKLTDTELIRWTLSHKHTQPDICDDYANHINKPVVEYLKETGLEFDPRGLYFADTLPLPPHPNCQCEYALATPDAELTSTKVDRSASKVRKLLTRILTRK